MKVSFTGLCFFAYVLCVFLGCDEGMKIADDIDSIRLAEQSGIPQWRRVPHKDITLQVPDNLLKEIEDYGRSRLMPRR